MALRYFLTCKIHQATVTEANPDYYGSIGIDEDILDAAGLLEYEQVHVAGLTGGERLITYAIKAPRGSGKIAMNGAAALRIVEGEKIIVFGFAALDERELADLRPRIILMGENNKIREIIEGRIEPAGAMTK